MCKDWFRKKEEIYYPTEIRFASNGRNTYAPPNELNGCVNDTNNLPASFLQQFPQTVVHRYFNYDVTGDKYIDRLRRGIAANDPGAIVCIIADSCFSETITRGNYATGLYNPYPTRSRYYPNPKLHPGSGVRRKIFATEETRCIVISGCQEHQTSADAWFENWQQYMGALSAALKVSIARGMTWQEWYDEAKRLIDRWGFDQIPTIAGPEWMRNRKIGDDQAFIMHNSSHGSNVNDVSGDEPDRRDETLYFDRHVTDDEISLELDKIAA